MPQFNHFETKSGQQIDPTFGLNALSEETKRKTKAREQMNIAANVIRQSLAADGKGLTKGTEVNIEEGGQYTFSGDNAAKDETNLYNIRKANYGKTGTGTNVTSKANFAPEQAALAKQAQDEAAMAVPHNTLRGGGTLTSASASATTPTPTTYPNLVQPLPVPPTPISPVTAGVLSGTPIPLNPLMAAAANLSPGTSLKSGQSKSENMSMTDSVSNNYQNLQEVTTTSDIEVRDQLGMNQSDLAVASAMEALNSQVYGTTNPGVYKGLMEQNSKTMQATNEALVNQKSGTTLNTLNQGSVNRSMSTSKGKDESKQQSAASGNPQQKLPTVNFVQTSSGQRNVAATVKPNGNYQMQSGTGVMFRNANLVSQIGASSGLIYDKQPDGSYSLGKGANEKKGIEAMYKNHAASMENYQHLDGHRWENKEVNGKKYVSFQRENNGKWEEIGYHEYDALHPVYTDGKNVESTIGNFAAGASYKPMPKLTARPGKYGASGNHVELTQAEADLLFGDQGQ